MANPLFNTFGAKPMDNGIQQFINEVRNFERTFKGNPKQEVQQMLNSGKLSQQQFNQYAQMANQIMAMMPK